jgi:hypothetical protein
MPAPLLSMCNGERGRSVIARAFPALSAQRSGSSERRDQATEIMNLSSRSPGHSPAEL